MNTKSIIIPAFTFCFHAGVSAQGQDLNNPALRVIYAMEGKDATLQSADEEMCYNWSSEKTAWDPQKAEFQTAFQLWDRHWVTCMKGNQYAVE